MNPYVNEKTLELNITHELMTALNATAVGFTQSEEYWNGADVKLYSPLGYVLILQYKASKSGSDRRQCSFLLNSNKNNNQHLSLHMLAQSNLMDVKYCFPIIRTNQFLANNQGSLLTYSPRIDPILITGNKNWNISHSITVDVIGTFTVHSEDDYNGEFKNNLNDVKIIKEKLQGLKPLEETMSVFIENILNESETYLYKSNLKGSVEHNFIFFSKNDKGNIGYFQLTARLKGR
jgi:hypothetical protein